MNNDIDPRAFKPEHAVTKPTVTTPMILVEPLREGGENEVFFQWYGDSTGPIKLVEEYGNVVAKTFNKAQFRFPIPMPVDDIHWVGDPELFRVVSINQVEDWWPNPQTYKELRKQHRPEKWILYVASTHFTVKNSNNENGPACFLIPLNVLLADQLYGITTPKKYHDPNF